MLCNSNYLAVVSARCRNTHSFLAGCIFSLSRIGKLLKILRSNVVNEVVIKKESDCHGVYIVELFC